MNIQLMLERDSANPALNKYAVLGDVLLQKQHGNKHESWEALCKILQGWTEVLQLPRLSEFGLTEDGLDYVVANSRGSSMKTNPIDMSDNEIKDLLLKRL
jgi:alcohol dehydrogenase class IV